MTDKKFIFYSVISKPTAPVNTQEELNKEEMASFIKTFREEDSDSDIDSDTEDSPISTSINLDELFSDSDDDDDDDNYELETPPQSESDTEEIYTPPVSDNEEEENEEEKEEVKFINPFDDPSLFTQEINKDNTYNPFDEFDVKPVSPPPLKIPEVKPVSHPPLDLCHPKNNIDLLIKKINKAILVYKNIVETESIWFVKLSGYNLLASVQNFYSKKIMEISAEIESAQADGKSEELPELEKQMNICKIQDTKVASLLSELKAVEADPNVKKYLGM